VKVIQGVPFSLGSGWLPCIEREFFIDNLRVRIHFIFVMIRWTGLAPWEFEIPFPGSLTSTFLARASSELPALEAGSSVTTAEDQPVEVSRGEKMLYSGTDPESYITEYTLVYEEKTVLVYEEKNQYTKKKLYEDQISRLAVPW